MLRPGKRSRTGAKEAREASETLGACAGLGDRAAAIVRAHRHGARLGLLVAHFDQSGFFGAWSTVARCAGFAFARSHVCVRGVGCSSCRLQR